MQTSLLKPKAINVEPLGGNKREGHARAVRARLRPHARQRAAPRAAVVDGRLRADRSDDRRRAARVLGDRRRPGRRRPHHAEPEGRGVPPAQPRRGDARPAQGRRRPGHRRRHPDAARRRDHQPRPRHRQPAAGGKLDMQIKVEKGRGYVPGQPAPLRRRADQVDRPDRPRRVVLAGLARQLHGRKRPRRAAHRPRQAGDGDRDQRRDHARRGDPLVGQDPGRAAGGVRAARRHDRRPVRADAEDDARSSTRSCCARSTSSSSRCARRTA